MAVSQLFIGPTAVPAPNTKTASVHRLGLQPTPPVERIDRLALPQIMTAARINQLGPPQIIALERVDVPDPQALQVLVRVCAAGVGPWDALVRTGKSGLPLTPPLTLGSEISGIVEKVGANTTGFAVGDEVFGATNPLFVMGYAEFAVVSARMIAKKPAALSHIEAAAMPVVGVMAWQMLFDHAALREGQTVVVHGAAGDVDYVRSLGAHEVINTETDNLTNFARRADAVIDTVGGPLQDQLLTFVKSGGIMVSSVSRPNVQLAQKRRVRADYFIVDVNTAQLARLAEMHDKNELVVPVGSVLPLSEARAAHEMLAGSRAHKRGKIVLQVAG